LAYIAYTYTPSVSEAPSTLSEVTSSDIPIEDLPKWVNDRLDNFPEWFKGILREEEHGLAPGIKCEDPEIVINRSGEVILRKGNEWKIAACLREYEQQNR